MDYQTNTPKVSVVIPVYGVEKYLERCARSLFEQTLDDIEYIFVNDCTPDSSMEVLAKVLEDYSSRKNQVKIINMPQNSGQGAVRRIGMMAAKGDFIIHCDSDDWVEPEMYEEMYLTAVSGNADIVCCDFQFEGKGNRIYYRFPDRESPSAYINLLDNGSGQGIWWSLWSRMYKTSLIQSNFIYPIPGMNMWEDMYVSVRAYYYANRIINIHKPYYHYDASREGSIVHKRFEDGIIAQQILCVKYLEDFFHKVQFDASKFLCNRKFSIKDKFLWKTPVDYNGFIHTFPETTIIPNTVDCSNMYRWCWKFMAENNMGNLDTIPFKIYLCANRMKNGFVKIIRKCLGML